jgi:exo-beta-1,3-glucanase (GH17 family)
MAANISIRQKAVADARRNVRSTSVLLHSVEVNRCLDPFGVRVHRDVLPISRPDIVSFSLYEAINTWGAQTYTEGKIQELFTKAIKTVKRQVGNYVPMMVGEFGWPERDPDFTFHNLSVGPLIQKVTDIANANNFTDMYYWQIYDNEELSPRQP